MRDAPQFSELRHELAGCHAKAVRHQYRVFACCFVMTRRTEHLAEYQFHISAAFRDLLVYDPAGVGTVNDLGF
jgi:hypothetical protein